MSIDLPFLSAGALVALFESGELSPVEVMTAMIERIDAVNPALNAFCHVDADLGYTMAKASEARWLRKSPIGLLDGVPIPVKDTNLCAGMPTLHGSNTTLKRGGTDVDNPVVTRLRQSGALFFCKTATPEFGWKALTDSPLTGITRNPWNPAKTPGGSSGGAAVALAVGVGPLATGGDGAGSIRVPCSFAGVFGLKPSYALVPTIPSSLGALSVAGPMSRTVADSALMLDVMTGPDIRDPYTVPKPCVSFQADLGRGIEGLRVAWSEDLGFGVRDPDVIANFHRSLAVLSDLGAIVEPVDLDLSGAREPFVVIWAMGMTGDLAQLEERERGLLDPGLRELLDRSKTISGERLQRAWKFVDLLSARMNALYADFDVLVTPTTPIPAFEAGIIKPEGAGFADWFDWTPLTWPFNLTRQPAASCPNGLTAHGMPTGLQVIGRPFDDALVLRVCSAFETANLRPIWDPARLAPHLGPLA